MKNLIIAVLSTFFSVECLSAQNVYLSKVEKTNENTEKQFLNIDPSLATAEYLGEIDVVGFSAKDAEVFSMVYKKAKEIGANAFSYKAFETVDGKNQPFNPAHYKISLYYVPKDALQKPSDVMYLFSSSAKPQTISVNRINYTLPPRTYTEIATLPGEIYTISTKKFLGSAVKVSSKPGAQYFQISALKVSSNTFGEPGINLKSGDIMALEPSYGDFLRMIYTQNK